MAMTGKRHDFAVDYEVGYGPDGVIRGINLDLDARCGCSADVSIGVVDRAMFHADNTYFLPDFRIHSRRVKTNTVSNTAFRGFGGPQGMLAIERVIDTIAWTLDRDPLDIRKANLYSAGRDVTPYGQTIDDHDVALRLIEELERSSNYRARRKEIAQFNARSPILKRGLALTPVKFGISFTLTHLNQAGALVHVYQDGSVHLNHGGTEMGQGLFFRKWRRWPPRNSASGSNGCTSPRRRPTRCRTRRPPRRRPAPTSTEWRSGTPRAKSGRG